MAGLPWIPLDVTFPTSAKAIALGVALQRPRAWSYVVQLWTEAAQKAADGCANGPAAVYTIETWAGWDGSPGELVQAMCLPHIRLLDETNGGFHIHDWEVHCGAHVEKREKDRQRMKRLRARTKSERSKTVREPFANVRGETDTERETEKESNETRAPVAAPIRPLAVYLQTECPRLYDLLQRAVFVDPGNKAALWGKAEALVCQVGPEATLACWAEAAAKRQGDPNDVPLAYVIKPLEALAFRLAQPPKPLSHNPDVDDRQEAARKWASENGGTRP